MNARFNFFSFQVCDFCYSDSNEQFKSKYKDASDFKPVNVNKECDRIIEKYDLIFSLHFKQLFPSKLVKSVLCVNLHPGYNPYNRGWFPHVFSILNGKPTGATLHILDEFIDHGPIIDQEEVDIVAWDTSESLYYKVLDMEIVLFERNFEKIINNSFITNKSVNEGNINFKKDYENLCKLDLSQTDSFHNFLNRLRALSHGKYHNCYFLDEKGNRIFVRVIIESEEK